MSTAALQQQNGNVQAPVNNVTQLVVWNPQLEAEVAATIKNGGSVSKAVALCAPKGFISKLRQQRRSQIEKNSSRLLGELSQQGFVLADMSATRTSTRTGDVSFTAKFVKREDPAKLLAERMGVSLEDLRAAISMVSAKPASAAPAAK